MMFEAQPASPSFPRTNRGHQRSRSAPQIQFERVPLPEILDGLHDDDARLLASGEAVAHFELAPKPSSNPAPVPADDGIDPRDMRDNPDDDDDDEEEGAGRELELDDDDDEG